jgi:FtsP/CotA-like multicopper oxidase with cupredoxin domain
MVHILVAKTNRHHRQSHSSSSCFTAVVASPYWKADKRTQWKPRRPYYMPNLLDDPEAVIEDFWNVSMDNDIDSNGKQHLEINQHHWEPLVPIRPLPLNQTVEYSLYKTNAHPFHIHINRMQIAEKGGCGYRYEEGEQNNSCTNLTHKDIVCSYNYYFVKYHYNMAYLLRKPSE